MSIAQCGLPVGIAFGGDQFERVGVRGRRIASPVAPAIQPDSCFMQSLHRWSVLAHAFNTGSLIGVTLPSVKVLNHVWNKRPTRSIIYPRSVLGGEIPPAHQHHTAVSSLCASATADPRTQRVHGSCFVPLCRASPALRSVFDDGFARFEVDVFGGRSAVAKVRRSFRGVRA